MSYYGSHSDAAADAKKADLRIDGLSPANTSRLLRLIKGRRSPTHRRLVYHLSAIASASCRQPCAVSGRVFQRYYIYT